MSSDTNAVSIRPVDSNQLPTTQGATMSLLVRKAFVLAIPVFLTACASTAPRPVFPPHLAHFADHPYFTEGCAAKNQPWRLSEPNPRVYFPESGAGIRDRRCAYLHQQLNVRLSQADRKFRESNRCVRRTQETDGMVRSDLRECRHTQEGWGALRDVR